MTQPALRAIRPDDPDHNKLETDVVSFLCCNGFFVESNTYHERLSLPFVERIKKMRNVNALVVRTRADRVAIHKTLDHSFCLECKTIPGEDLVMEALQLAVHRSAAKQGECCLYIVRDTMKANAFEGCFWAHQSIPYDRLFIPPKHHGSNLERRLVKSFPDAEVRRMSKEPRGSGDPFIRVPRRELASPFIFPDWRAACLTISIPDEEGTNEPKTCTANGAYPSKASSEMPGDLFRGL